MRSPVLSKAAFYPRFIAGEFGNRGPMWTTLDDWNSSRYFGKVMLRSNYKGGLNMPNVPMDQVVDAWNSYPADDKPTISAMCPHDKQTINGELQVDHRGLNLFYSHVKDPMRPSLAKGGVQAFGLHAELVLSRSVLYAPDLDWLKHLLAEYPGHVVEFTAFTRRWGTVPRSQCVVWEVRRY